MTAQTDFFFSTGQVNAAHIVGFVNLGDFAAMSEMKTDIRKKIAYFSSIVTVHLYCLYSSM